MKRFMTIVALLVVMVPLSSSAQRSTRQPEAYQWGVAGDVPISGDFDGDHIQDLVVYRPSSGSWFMRLSGFQLSVYSTVTVRWGQAGDVPMPGDYDGDGKTDVAVWRPSTGVWYILFSDTTTQR